MTTVSKRKTKKPKRKIPAIIRPKPEPIEHSSEYEAAYYIAMEKSLIFHPDTPHNRVSMIRPCLGSLSGLRTLKEIWDKRGNPKASSGKRNKFGVVHLAELDVQHCEEKFEKEKQDARMLGNRIPDYMSEGLFPKYEEARAELEVAQSELAEIKERIRTREKRDRIAEFKPFMPYGPIGVGHGRPLTEIDSQMVTMKNNELVICDKRSKYNGMKIYDYKEQVVHPFLQAIQGERRFTERSKKDWPPRPKGF